MTVLNPLKAMRIKDSRINFFINVEFEFKINEFLDMEVNIQGFVFLNDDGTLNTEELEIGDYGNLVFRKEKYYSGGDEYRKIVPIFNEMFNINIEKMMEKEWEKVKKETDWEKVINDGGLGIYHGSK